MGSGRDKGEGSEVQAAQREARPGVGVWNEEHQAGVRAERASGGSDF